MNQETKEARNNLEELQIPSWVQPDGGSKKKRKKCKLNLYYVVSLICGIIIGLTMMITVVVKNLDHGRKVIVEQTSYYEEILNEQENVIEELNQQQLDVADNLYKTVKLACEDSDNEVIKRLWKEKFPNKKSFTKDRTQGLIIIYVMFDNHIELKTDAQVADAVQSVSAATIGLWQKMELYNTYYEFYLFWVNNWNDSQYIRMIEGEKENNFQPKQIQQTQTY